MIGPIFQTLKSLIPEIYDVKALSDGLRGKA